MVTPHSHPHDPPSDTAHALSESERQRLRTLVTLAAEAIPLNWPMRTFISRNPLMGFEHLPFDQAVSQAKELFGAHELLLKLNDGVSDGRLNFAFCGSTWHDSAPGSAVQGRTASRTHQRRGRVSDHNGQAPS